MAAWLSISDRVPVDKLLHDHAGVLQELRDSLSIQELPMYVDDVWLLRYILSYKCKVKAATDAARRALEWRSSPHGEAVIDAARVRAPPPSFSDDELRNIDAFLVSGFHHVSSFEDPVLVIRAGLSNAQVLMDTISIEKLTAWLTYFNECAYQYCDAQTRRRGYFVKVITMMDLQDVRFIQERRFFKAMGASSKTNEWLFPQLIGKTIFLNPPGWVKFAFTVASKFMSPKSIEKVTIHKEPLSLGRGTCPFPEVLEQQRLPSFLGGLCDCEGGCVGRLPNRATAMRSREEGAKHPYRLSGLRKLPQIDGASATRSRTYDEDSDGAVWWTPPSTPQMSAKMAPWDAVPVAVTPRLDERSVLSNNGGSANHSRVEELELNGSACRQPDLTSHSRQRFVPQSANPNLPMRQQSCCSRCCTWCRKRRRGSSHARLLNVSQSSAEV